MRSFLATATDGKAAPCASRTRGPKAARRAADDELARCVGEQYQGWMGALMESGVRVGGVPWAPAHWRWGYGHRYPAGYPGSKD